MNEDEKKRLEEEPALANQGKGSSGNPNSEPVGLNRIVMETPQPTAVTPVTFNYSDYVDSLEPPISKEEQAKRERAAKAVQGVGALGNLMSAFANLTYTGQGAPSQTIPTQYVENLGKERETWREKLKSEREKYAAADLSARVQDYQLREQRRKEQERLNQRAEDVAWRQSEAERSQRNADRERTDRLAQQALQNQQAQDRIDISRAQEYRLRGDKDRPIPFVLDDRTINISADKWKNETNVAKVYSKLPEDVRTKLETVIEEDQYGNKKARRKNLTADEMRSAIGMYLGNAEVANELRRLAGVETKEAKGANQTIAEQASYDNPLPAQSWGSQWPERMPRKSKTDGLIDIEGF